LKKRRHGFPDDSELLEIAQGLSQSSIENLFYSIGNGSLSTVHVVQKIIPEEEVPEKDSVIEKVLEKFRFERGIKIDGMGNMMFRFAGCCQPIPGEEVIGYITRGRGVTIHRMDCPAAQELIKQPERTIPVSWDVSKDQTFVVRLEVNVSPRKNILAEITESIADSNTNVKGADINLTDASSTGFLIVEVNNLSQLERALSKIRKVKGVISVRRALGGEHPAE